MIQRKFLVSLAYRRFSLPIMPAAKRKAESALSTTSKKPRPDFSDRSRYRDSSLEEKHGIILREFYPPEMTNSRANEYAAGQVERPIETLKKAIKDTQTDRDKIQVGKSVVHWFKMDLRTRDNTALHLASQKAKLKGVPLICLSIVSPQDLTAHLTAPVRVDFMLRNLQVLQRELAKLDIPLYVETVEKRRKVPSRIIELCKAWGTSHIYCNMEYEVDELRREALLTRECLDNSISFNVVHDTCVVEPGPLKTGAGGQMAVYSPWFRKWVAHVNAHPDVLKEHPAPSANPSSSRKDFPKLFDVSIPTAPENKKLSKEEGERFHTMWPVGEAEAHERLAKFVRERIKNYADTRNIPSGNGTSALSCHLAQGTISARACVRAAQEASPNRKVTDDRKQGHSMWIGEVAWRDFYKHVLVNWPQTCMNKCFKPEYTSIEWEYDTEQFKAWTEGRTGFPIVDAAMRQCNHSGYMHNRCRMIVASFLAKDLLIDWRMGERYFMEHLIDGDFASNNGGWGFSASCGVDPQPYFRIFNPLLQSEKFDPEGDYIRKWVDELKNIKGKAIHDPYGRGASAEASKRGYPKPMVDHKQSRDRCLERYKKGLGRSTA